MLQVAQAAGARLIATAGSPAKRWLLRGLGTQAVLCSRDLHFPGQLACINSVDCILNSLTAPGFVAASVAALATGGRLVEISKRDIWSPQRVAQERPDLGYSLVAVDFLTPAAVHASLMRVAAGLASAQLTPLPQVGPMHDELISTAVCPCLCTDTTRHGHSPALCNKGHDSIRYAARHASASL